MKRVVATLVALIVLVALAAASYASGVLPGTDGCALRSVDKDSYAAENEGSS